MPGKRARVAKGLAAALRLALMRTFARAARKPLAPRYPESVSSILLNSHVNCESTPLYESAITATTPFARERAESRDVKTIGGVGRGKGVPVLRMYPSMPHQVGSSSECLAAVGAIFELVVAREGATGRRRVHYVKEVDSVGIGRVAALCLGTGTEDSVLADGSTQFTST